MYNLATSNATRKFVGSVTASRYSGNLSSNESYLIIKAIPLPQNFPPKDFTPIIDQKEDVFNYDKVEDDGTVEWYVNFAGERVVSFEVLIL